MAGEGFVTEAAAGTGAEGGDEVEAAGVSVTGAAVGAMLTLKSCMLGE